MTQENLNDINEYLKRISGRILIAYDSFYLWKAMQVSINAYEIGQEEAERNVVALNFYQSIFPTILYSLESTFIIELYKFFDKGADKLKLANPESLEAGIAKSSISDENKKQIQDILLKHEKTIEQLKKLRHTLYAHDPLEVGSRQGIQIPPVQDIETLFVGVKDILNLISQNTIGIFHGWDDDTGHIERLFKQMLGDLERGKQQRFKEQEERRTILTAE